MRPCHSPFARLVLILLSVLLLPAPARGQAAEEIDKRIAQLGSKDEKVRELATRDLQKIGSPAVPALIVALSNEDETVRLSATVALYFLGPKAAPAVPALAAALGRETESEDARQWTAVALERIGPKAAPAVPALAEALSNESWKVRYGAADALGAIGPKAAPAVPALIGALSDDVQPVRANAAIALDTIGVDQKALWWVVPRVYWKEIAVLLLALAAWFGLMARFPKHRPVSAPKHLALMTLTAAVPVALACAAVRHATTRFWTQYFLPDAVTLIPFHYAAVLTTALVLTLPAVWVCQRKSRSCPPTAPTP